MCKHSAAIKRRLVVSEKNNIRHKLHLKTKEFRCISHSIKGVAKHKIKVKNKCKLQAKLDKADKLRSKVILRVGAGSGKFQ